MAITQPNGCKQPRNLAELKRMLRPGVWLESTYHMAFGGRGENGQVIYKDEPRQAYPVHRVTTVAWTHRLPPGHRNAGQECWMHFQKASDWEFFPDRFCHYEEDRGQRILCLTYRFVEAPNGTPQEG